MQGFEPRDLHRLRLKTLPGKEREHTRSRCHHCTGQHRSPRNSLLLPWFRLHGKQREEKADNKKECCLANRHYKVSVDEAKGK
jgi:hypothetical protein